MQKPSEAIPVLRRAILQSCAASTILSLCPESADADEIRDNDRAFIEELIGRTPTESPRVRIDMPSIFGNGYSVPLTLAVDSPMTESDNVKAIVVVAPRNPIVTVVKFSFTSHSGRAQISTRIRLSQPQDVLAVAEMSDGSLLMARSWVKVDTDGCT